MINVLGDALAAGIMAHICRKDFARDTGSEVRTGLPLRDHHKGADFSPTAGQYSTNPSIPLGLGVLKG